jgi:predicted CopG family antitoxin
VGRTIPTYRLHLESILNDWMDYRRALREKDREAFDRIVSKARQHASAASYCAHMDPTVLAILSVLLEMEKEARSERDIHMHMDMQDEMAKNVALADDVYEMLQKDKREGESFSEVIRRWRRSKGSLLDFFGVWGDIPDEEFRKMEEAIYSADRPIAEELKHLEGWSRPKGKGRR